MTTTNTAAEFAAALDAEKFTLESGAHSLTKLEGDGSKKAEGQFVLNGQPLATDKGFRNVSHLWFDKTQTYEQGLEQLEKEKARTIDISATVGEFVPTVDDKGNFVFQHKPTQKFYRPTEHAMGQVGNWADTGTWFVQSMLVNPTDYKARDKYIRDRGDAETLAKVIANGFRRLDKDKKFFFRCRTDGTMRAMLTDRYAVVDNRWFVEKLREYVPGGRLSHWRGDGDTLYGNVLIPDTIRADSDSDYGGMISVGNSEIGERRVSSQPSIFRAICMNGCIWGQTKGKGIKQVHRGKINLDVLAREIYDNLTIQIPLLPAGIDRLLNTRQMEWDGVDGKVVLAQVANDAKFSTKQTIDLLASWRKEISDTPDFQNSLFGIVNGITRAGQLQTNEQWVKFDTLAGELLDGGKDGFERMIKKAKSLTVKEVAETFGEKTKELAA